MELPSLPPQRPWPQTALVQFPTDYEWIVKATYFLEHNLADLFTHRCATVDVLTLLQELQGCACLPFSG